MARTLVLLLLAAVFVPGAASAEPRGPCTAGDVEVDEAHQKVVVSFSNHCEAKVTCAVSWSLRCGKGAARAASENVSIDGHTEHRLEASAATCGDGDWRISPPRWRCREEGEATIERGVRLHRRR